MSAFDPKRTLAVRCAAIDLMPVLAPTKYSIESLRCCLLSLGADMRRREFITLLGGVVTVWPLAARAQSVTIPEIGFLGTGSSEATINLVLAFSQGLSQAGFVEGQNVKIEYRWANNEYDRLSKLVEDFVRRQVAVIATPFSKAAATVAKRANTTIPVVFSIAGDPINLVSSPA